MKRILLALGLAASFTLSACGQRHSEPAQDSSMTGQIQQFLRRSLQKNQIVVVDRFGTPLANADVLIGNAVDSPFVGNFVRTTPQGILLIPAEWTVPLPITIEAPGLVRTTFLKIAPQPQILELNESEGRSNLEVTGQTQDWTNVKKDGFVDFSIVMPMVRRSALFDFNVSDLLSPEVDRIQAYGQDIFLPSNFSLPKQSENYGVFPISLEKLVYRAYVRRPDPYRFVAARGRFPFKTVIGKLENGQSYWEILNDMDFISAGAGNILASLPSNPLNLSVAGFNIAPSIKVTATSLPAGASFLASVWNEDQGVHFPSDVKTFVNNESRVLETTPGKNQYVMSIVGKHKVLKSAMITLEERSSRAITPITSGDLAPVHLPLIASPIFDGQTVMAEPPALIGGLAKTGMSIVISDVNVTDTETSYHETKNKIWEIFSTDWDTQIELPAWPSPVGQGLIKRLEVIYLAAPLSKSQTPTTQVGPAMVDLSTHATKNSLDF